MKGTLIKILSAYKTLYPNVLAYMWQSSEYGVRALWKWWLQVPRFDRVAYRGTLVGTSNARKARLILWAIAVTYWVVNLLSVYLGANLVSRVVIVILAVLLYPLIVVIISTVIIWVLRKIWQMRAQKVITQAKEVLASHEAIVIAVAGSYGKTSCKDMLETLLKSSLKIAVTQGNQNTLLSQAKFALGLNGDEDVLLVEFGEGAPGDIQKMVDLVQPDYAIITGLAPNHLDQYKTLDAVADDFAVLARFVGKDRCYINSDNKQLADALGDHATAYATRGFMGWLTSNIKVELQTTSFALKQKTEEILIETKLPGRHNIAPLTLAVVLAMELGVDKTELREQLQLLKAYEHRMELRDLGGMWMIDDTYNGNIEGMKAGLAYLKEIKISGRKLYATPGLVDQGDQTESVHRELGEAIAQAKPDQVYLMDNSVRETIQDALESKGYKGQVTIIEKPLEFYQNIQDVLAVGDVILCQNDWPDQYA